MSGPGGEPPPAAPRVIYGQPKALLIHLVTDEELTQLAAGGPDALHLNFSIALLSAAFSLLIAVLTAEMPSDRVYQTFLVVMCVFFILGGYFAMRWWPSRQRTALLVRSIRQRMAPSGEADPAGTEVT